MKTYGEQPESIFNASKIMAPVGKCGDRMEPVFNMGAFGFFTIKDLTDNMKECIASVEAEWRFVDIQLDRDDLAELEGYMQEFLNEYSIIS